MCRLFTHQNWLLPSTTFLCEIAHSHANNLVCVASRHFISLFFALSSAAHTYTWCGMIADCACNFHCTLTFFVMTFQFNVMSCHCDSLMRITESMSSSSQWPTVAWQRIYNHITLTNVCCILLLCYCLRTHSEFRSLQIELSAPNMLQLKYLIKRCIQKRTDGKRHDMRARARGHTFIAGICARVHIHIQSIGTLIPQQTASIGIVSILNLS